MSELRRVRSIDVAKLAGVSRSAVSRTFTEGASVAKETRRKVEEAAVALGYRPNAIARMLITRRTGIVGVVVSDLQNPFYAGMLDALSSRLQVVGLMPLLFNCADAHELDELFPKLLACQVEGVIITVATLSSRMAKECLHVGTPVVLVNRTVLDAHVSSVACDNRLGGELVADHLLDRGFRRLSFVAGIEDTSSSRDREAGFLQRVRLRGGEIVRRQVGHYTYVGGLEAARVLLRSGDQPQAVFCANDVMALALIDSAKDEFGLRIPEDIAVAGFDDTFPASWPAYDLTSADQNVVKMVDGAVDVLLGCMHDARHAPEHRLITPVLRIRASTMPPGASPAIHPPSRRRRWKSGCSV